MSWDHCVAVIDGAVCGQESCATVHMTKEGHDFMDNDPNLVADNPGWTARIVQSDPLAGFCTVETWKAEQGWILICGNELPCPDHPAAESGVEDDEGMGA